MKKETILVALFLFPLFGFARNFHFVYLRVDESMEISEVKKQISSLKDLIQGDDFVLYYSNSKKVMEADSYDEKELFGLVGEQMTSYDITIPDEIEIISGLFEKYLQAEFDESHRLVSPLYNQITLDFITGKDFLAKGYQDEILARGILVNNLLDFDMQINFYPAGADYSFVEFDPLYKIKHKINVKSL